MSKIEYIALYYKPQCPFCQKVLSVKDELGQEFELCDTASNSDLMEEQLEATGKKTVPCLKITKGDAVEWLYESGDICNYLKNL
ncbi:MAG: glutaredoxin [Gammaproteobacteria bacterium]|nr:MAG: glutaredoxin [Gammaproteobacteria bacterium]